MVTLQQAQLDSLIIHGWENVSLAKKEAPTPVVIVKKNELMPSPLSFYLYCQIINDFELNKY
jgi:hypothetical protein